MRNFQDTFKTRKQSFISAFSICMTIPSKATNTDVMYIDLDKRTHTNKQNQ